MRPQLPQFVCMSVAMGESEEDYFTKKERRKEKKRISGRDRSKYKKSEFSKHIKRQEELQAKKVAKQKTSRGRVLSIYTDGIMVYAHQKKYLCTLRGRLKQEQTRSKNLIVVGDFVAFQKASHDEGVIASIEKRRSVLARKSSNKQKMQLMAANIDQVLIVASMVDPILDPTLIDRAIIAARKGNMRPVIVLNKMDLVDTKEEEYREFINGYQGLRIPILQISCRTGQGIEALMQKMKKKVSVFAGLSGVGKSSLINAACNLDLAINEVADKTGRGRHTTTRAHLIRLESGGWCIDTPGIQNFGVWELTQQDLVDHYRDLGRFASNCQYSRCTHTHEPDCAVKRAVEANKLSSLRYRSYLKLLKSSS